MALVAKGVGMVARIRKRTCRWPRFSRYEIRDGRIAPAAGARIHWYDPMGDYLQSKKETRGQPPYMSLVALVGRLNLELSASGWRLEENPGVAPPLSDQSINGILAWTSRHGLL